MLVLSSFWKALTMARLKATPPWKTMGGSMLLPSPTLFRYYVPVPGTAVDNVLNAVPHLLLVHHVRFGEHRTPPGDAHGRLALQGTLGKLFDSHMES